MRKKEKLTAAVLSDARGKAILLLILFLAACNRAKIIDDYITSDFQSLLTRLLLIIGAAIIIGMRIQAVVRMRPLGKVRHVVVLVIFLIVLFYPLFSRLSVITEGGGRVVEKVETRLEKAGGASFAGVLRAFPGAYEQFIRKRDIVSKAFIYLDGIVKVYLLKVSPSTKVALGKDGFFYEGYGARKVEEGIVERFDNIADYMGQIPFSEEDLASWQRTLEERSYWLKQKGIEYVFVLAPTKAFVYPEFLPGSIEARKGRTRYEQLSAFLRTRTDIHFIDLLPGLLEAKQKRSYPLLFYKTDFHWNYYGSLIAYQEIVKGVNRIFPKYDLEPYRLEDFTVKVNRSWAHHRFMELISLPPFLHKNDHYLTLKPRQNTTYVSVKGLPEEGIHDVRIPKKEIVNENGEKIKIRLIENSAEDLPLNSIVLLGDSFLEKCVYYFSGHAKRVLNQRTIVNFPARIFRVETPDIVIQEVLNMFILRPPPGNPQNIRQAWLEKKYEDAMEMGGAGSGRVEVPRRSGGNFFIRIPPSPGLSTGKRFAVYRIPVENRSPANISLTIQAYSHEESVKKETYTLSPGRNSVFFEISAGEAERIVITPAAESSAGFDLGRITRAYTDKN